jgi:hypothetical protein
MLLVVLLNKIDNNRKRFFSRTICIQISVAIQLFFHSKLDHCICQNTHKDTQQQLTKLTCQNLQRENMWQTKLPKILFFLKETI